MVPLMKGSGKHWGKKGLLQNSSKVDGTLQEWALFYFYASYRIRFLILSGSQREPYVAR